MLYVLLWVTLCPFQFCNHLNREERAGCFALFVFLMSHDCCVALPQMPWVCLQFVIVVFPDHTHYFCDKLLCVHSSLAIILLWKTASCFKFNGIIAFLSVFVFVLMSLSHSTVNSKIFERVLFLWNFAYREIILLPYAEITLLFTDICKSCPSCAFLTSQKCLLTLFAKIKFRRKISNLQYYGLICDLGL